ncbi:MAG TPA: VWA domain-containing protein [Thermoanaerobaculia bacterium]|nr:VWA domain-containing protein [Thermoanaerobaculia bacterium]
MKKTPVVPPPDLAPDDAAALLRWRLALGSGAEDAAPEMRLAGLGAFGMTIGAGEGEGESGGESLDQLDDALSFVYGGRAPGGTNINVPRWLSLVRRFFREDVVALVQKDAIEKKGLTRLLFEPETLPYLEKNVDLVATLLGARGLVPDEAKETARQIVREVVEELRKKLETETRTAIYGAVRRNSESPLKVARNIDWKKTISRNLRTWDREQRRLVPERFYFWANQRKRHEWNVSILVDQSGSMAVSAVYSAVMAAIFASLDVLNTHLALFNEREIVDMTPMLVDPVEVLFTAQLGGAEDLNRAVAFAEQNFIERPDKTILLLITDLYDTCGDVEQLIVRAQRLVESKVKMMVLLKLSDEGRPSYNHELAKRLTAAGVYCFGCTPRLLVQIVERVMKGQDISTLVSK